MHNVFEHQQFLLRRPPTPEYPAGERVRRSFREIMTGPDEPLRFDYRLEYLNVAALNLCAALTQAFFEPENLSVLEKRLATPMTEEEFEQGIADQRELFSIDGETRFLQGNTPPEKDKKGRIVNLALLHEKLNMTTSDFMNRAENDWVVSLDQIPLLLFSRITFYEKSAGRGYLTGTSGDLEIRTFPVDPASLRRTVWLNVLAHTLQNRLEGDFEEAGSGKGYDEWMWVKAPAEDVPRGASTLRAGLFWMVASNYVILEEVEEPRPCIVTGEMITGRHGTGVVTRSTGIGYGIPVEREKGPAVRMSFFRHPNGPAVTRKTKEEQLYTQHLSVDEVSGLFGQMGGLFFSSPPDGSRDVTYQVAPVIEQYLGLDEDSRPQIDLLCFGFHMLSSKKNVHGGYEYELFHDPTLENQEIGTQETAQGILERAADNAETIRKILTGAVEMCAMV